jgi:hypothetical protein
MGLYNFKARFVPMIISGDKTHTIRALRAHPDKPGNTLHLYTGLRTKKAKLLMRVPCVRVEQIEIEESNGSMWGKGARGTCSITIDGQLLSPSEAQALARRDGFRDFAEMMQFWDGRRPFKGHIIHWRTK